MPNCLRKNITCSHKIEQEIEPHGVFSKINIDFSRECRILLSDIRLDKSFTFNNGNVTLNQEKRKKYTCYICYEKFNTAFQLYKHKETHEDEETFSPATKKYLPKVPEKRAHRSRERRKKRSRNNKKEVTLVHLPEIILIESDDEYCSISSESSFEFTFDDCIDYDSDTEFREDLISPTTGLISTKIPDPPDEDEKSVVADDLPSSDSKIPEAALSLYDINQEKYSRELDPYETKIMVTTNFKCIACDFNFQTLAVMIQHILVKMPYCVFVCVRCDKKMSPVSLLEDMCKHKLSYNFFECIFCDENFFEYETLQVHLVDAHRFSQCKTDPENYLRASCANFQNKDIAFTFKCAMCNFTSIRSDDLEQHVCQHNAFVTTSECSEIHFQDETLKSPKRIDIVKEEETSEPTSDGTQLVNLDNDSETMSIVTDDIGRDYFVKDEEFEITDNRLEFDPEEIISDEEVCFKIEALQESPPNNLELCLASDSTNEWLHNVEQNVLHDKTSILDKAIMESQIFATEPQLNNDEVVSANRMNELFFDSINVLKNTQSYDDTVEVDVSESTLQLIQEQTSDENKKGYIDRNLSLASNSNKSRKRKKVSRVILPKPVTSDDLLQRLNSSAGDNIYSMNTSGTATRLNPSPKALNVLNQEGSRTNIPIANSGTSSNNSTTALTNVMNRTYEPRKAIMSLTDDSDFLEQINTNQSFTGNPNVVAPQFFEKSALYHTMTPLTTTINHQVSNTSTATIVNRPRSTFAIGQSNIQYSPNILQRLVLVPTASSVPSYSGISEAPSTSTMIIIPKKRK